MNIDELFYIATPTWDEGRGDEINDNTQLWLNDQLPTDTYLDFLQERHDYVEKVLNIYELVLNSAINGRPV
ncbi:MAG: hypothetical protein WBA93_36760 [Microcoleaceae cyanobacterium]